MEVYVRLKQYLHDENGVGAGKHGPLIKKDKRHRLIIFEKVFFQSQWLC